MPREFLKPRKKREPHSQAKRIESSDNRMIDRAPRNRTFRECAIYEDSHWPAPVAQRRD